jgi:hypothetical protein
VATPHGHGRSLLEHVMSITNHNGSINLTSFAEFGSVLDPASLPSGPEEHEHEPTQDSHAPQESPAAQSSAPPDLASLIAQLASIGTSLDTTARQDAHARDRAAFDLARYEALLADQQEAERALTEARRLRAAAEQLAANAFTDEARAHAAQQAASARALEMSGAQVLADRSRALEELAARPHLARALADRRRLDQQRAEAAQRAEAERDERLASGLAALKQALAIDNLDQAQKLLEPLTHEFADNADVKSLADRTRWRVRHALVAPAEEALHDVVRRPYRDNPEAVVARLADLHIHDLPEDLGRRIFGVWSNACYSVVQQRGWQNPQRYAPFTSRGMVYARPTPAGPDTVVSSLGMPEWQPADVVTDQRVLKTSRRLPPPAKRA